MRVLVVGGYGLIGLEIVRTLLSATHEVTGLVRSASRGQRFEPRARWIGADLRRLVSPDSWQAHLEHIDAVVNASGALQEGLGDELAAIQDASIRALIAACEAAGIARFVQISAPGASLEAGTSFLRTKAVADATLRNSRLDWVIFRPGLVIGRNAYGGSALLRLLAGFPWAVPLVGHTWRIQTVAIDDVANAVSLAIAGTVPSRRDYDLVEPEARSLQDTVLAMRAWLGYPPPRIVHVPAGVGFALARLADGAGWLGWRSPLRTTALRALQNGVTGNPRPWEAVTKQPLRTLEQTLVAMPATRQERVFARAELIKIGLVPVLSAFWLASGIIALLRLDSAADVVDGAAPWSRAFVAIAALADIGIGVALAFRRSFRAACVAAAALALAYLAGATLWVPELWFDPLGPLVKAVPALMLALAGAALAEER